VAYIAYRGVNGTTAVNMAVNIIQITALLVFSVIAIAYRVQHKQGSTGFHLSNGVAVNYVVAQDTVKDDKGNPTPVLDANNKPTMDKDGKPVYQMTDATDKDGIPVPADKDGKAVTDPKLAAPFTVSYAPEDAITGKAGDDKDPQTFNFHSTAGSVIAPHSFNFVFIQACIAILILVGFESVTAMGEEAKNAKRDIPRAVLLSLAIQGIVCYLIEYFAANYLLHNGYTIPNAAASGAPVGDMMVIVGTWLFGSYAAGKAFMLVQAATVFLALIGTTLACLNTGARVTYAMGRDNEVPSHFACCMGARSRRIARSGRWQSSPLSSALLRWRFTSGVPRQRHSTNIASGIAFGIFSPETYAKLPNTLVIITLISNFGTFLLYMMTCVIAIVAFREHHMFNGFKHFVVPVFGLLANLACMLFYLIGPFTVSGMS